MSGFFQAICVARPITTLPFHTIWVYIYIYMYMYICICIYICIYIYIFSKYTQCILYIYNLLIQHILMFWLINTCLRIQMIANIVVNMYALCLRHLLLYPLCTRFRNRPVLIESALDIRGDVHCFGWHHGVPELLQSLDCANLALLDSTSKQPSSWMGQSLPGIGHLRIKSGTQNPSFL